MARTRLFKSNRSQAVRLPKEVAFPDSVKEVTIVRDGARRVITPANAAWDDFFDAPGIDLPEREQPHVDQREEL
jgi:antitoxin VapB